MLALFVLDSCFGIFLWFLLGCFLLLLLGFGVFCDLFAGGGLLILTVVGGGHLLRLHFLLRRRLGLLVGALNHDLEQNALAIGFALLGGRRLLGLRAAFLAWPLERGSFRWLLLPVFLVVWVLLDPIDVDDGLVYLQDCLLR